VIYLGVIIFVIFLGVVILTGLMGSPKDHGAFGPFLPALPTPMCYCGLPAFVKQSRHPESAGRAFYLCQLTRGPPTLDKIIEGCNFYQWIDGHEMFDPLIRLFPYDPWKSCSYSEFVRWVPPPPNPPEMTEEEKMRASFHRLSNPPFCKCGISATLTNPSRRDLFTPFFRCRLPNPVSYHAINGFVRLFVFCTYYIHLSHLYFCREGFHLVILRSTFTDPKRIGLQSMTFYVLKPALRSGHAQGCLMLSASVASRLKKELFHLSLDLVTTVAMLMGGRVSFG